MSQLRIDKYILKEIGLPTLLSLLIFSFVILMGRIPRLIELIISKGVPLKDILLLFSYLLPTFFSITIPLSFLLGILLAFGRLSADSEFIALKASGISLYALLKPVLLLAVIFSILTAWITISVEPAGKTAFRSKLFEIASSRASVGIRPGVFNDDFDDIILFTRSMDERRGIMQNVFISDEREGETPATILAKEGRFISDQEQLSLTLRLSNGSIHRRPPNENKATYQIIGFSNYDITIDMGQQLGSGKQRRRSRSELSWEELQAARQNAKSDRSRFRLDAAQHKRLAIPFAPLVLALVGVPLGLQSSRSGKGAGFAMALIVSLFYYLLLSITRTLAEKGLVPAYLALWLPNFLFFFGGAYFLYRTAIERPVTFLAHPVHLFKRLFTKPKTEPGDGQ